MSNYGTATTPGQVTTFRDLWQSLSPPWLQGYYGLRLGYTLGIQYDALWICFAYSIRFGLATYAPYDAFTWLAQDRQIQRGENEPLANYAVRLREWLDLWRLAGGAASIMQGMYSYIGPTYNLTIEHVKQMRVSSNAYATTDVSDWDVFTNGADVNVQESPHNWDWDSNGKDPADQRFDQVSLATGVGPPSWRTWIIIYAGTRWVQDGTWGSGGLWGDGGTWGSNMTQQESASLRAQWVQWKGAQSLGQWIILAFDPTWFVYSSAQGSAKLPNGTWGRHGSVQTIGGVSVYAPSRTSTAIYLDGVS